MTFLYDQIDEIDVNNIFVQRYIKPKFAKIPPKRFEASKGQTKLVSEADDVTSHGIGTNCKECRNNGMKSVVASFISLGKLSEKGNAHSSRTSRILSISLHRLKKTQLSDPSTATDMICDHEVMIIRSVVIR